VVCLVLSVRAFLGDSAFPTIDVVELEDEALSRDLFELWAPRAVGAARTIEAAWSGTRR